MTREEVAALSGDTLRSIVASTSPTGRFADVVRWAKEELDRRWDIAPLRTFDQLKELIDGMLVSEGYTNTFTALRDVVADHTVDQDETIRDAIVPVLESIIAILPEED